MKRMLSLIYLSVSFGCSANHNTQMAYPTHATVYVDGNDDGTKASAPSDYEQCLRDEGYFDKVQNPYALGTCQDLFQE